MITGRIANIFLCSLCLALTAISVCFATPSSLFWTYCTTSVQPKGTYHIDLDNYFSVGNRAKNGTAFPTDFGLLAGVFSWKNVSGEAGIDYLAGARHPVYFNGKVGIAESVLFEKSPSFSTGVFNVGTRHSTNQRVFDAVLGTTLGYDLGKFYVGAYHGKHLIGKHRSGWMVGYEKPFCPRKSKDGKDYDLLKFTADYASSKNTIGGGGFALYYYFTPTISLESGPVWFNDTKANGRWKWSVQLDIDI